MKSIGGSSPNPDDLITLNYLEKGDMFPAHMYGSGDNVQEVGSVGSLLPVWGSGDETQVLGLAESSVPRWATSKTRSMNFLSRLHT